MCSRPMELELVKSDFLKSAQTSALVAAVAIDFL
jgi:hypothetical protein